MSKLKIRLIALGLLIGGVFAWVVTTQGPLAAVKVTLDKASRGSLSNGVFGVGTLEARHSFNLAPTMTSRVSRVLVDQGDAVHVGQLLAEMEVVDLQDRVHSSEQAAERSQYAISVAEAQLVEAQSRAQAAAAAYARIAELGAGGYVSQEMQDAKLHEKNAALASVAAANASLASAKLEQQRTRSEASGVSKVRAQTRLLSPVNGIVTARLAEPGVTVVAGQTVLQVIDPKSIWVKTRIEQKHAALVQAGQKAEIVLRSHPNQPLPGVVRRVEQMGDAITEERIVNVAFADNTIKPVAGELAEVTIKLPPQEQVLSVPSAAVKKLEQQDGVWIMHQGKVVFKPVQVAASTLEGRTQILDGLNEGDEVIVYSQQALQSGMKVKAVTEIVKAAP